MSTFECIVFWGSFAVIIILMWLLSQASMEIDDLLDENRELVDEANELDKAAREARNEAARLRALLEDQQFARICDSVREATS